MAKKVIERILYTEVVVFDDNGEEVYRERMEDDMLYDSETEYISSNELEEYL